MTHSRRESLGSLTKHHKYYIEMADLHILAQRTLFRVHSYFFARDSPVFNRKLNPVSPGDVREGTTEADPIVLEDVTPEQFETLLWVFYNPKYTLYDTSVDDWKTILSLANRWEFHEVKELAVRELHKKTELDIIHKMALYQSYQVDQVHLLPLYGELCRRDTPLTLTESRILGLEAAVLVNTARELLRARPSSGGLSPLPQGLEDADIDRTIQSLLTEGEVADFFSPSSENPPESQFSGLFANTDRESQQRGSNHNRGNASSATTRGGAANRRSAAALQR